MNRIYEANRDQRFDILRTIGLLCIILAHVSPPAYIFQIRNFDVPMMVLISGSVYTYSNRKFNYKNYFYSRFVRLVAPTWIFITVYLLLRFLLSLISANSSYFPYSVSSLIKVYFLLSGMGYIWIIKVFIMVALIVPLFNILLNKVKNIKIYIMALVFIYIVYELCNQFLNCSGYLDSISRNNPYLAIPYSIIAGFGLVLPRLNRNSIVRIFAIFTIVFIVCASFLYYKHNSFIATQAYKYPPTIYYLSYAMSVSFLLYIAINSLYKKEVTNKFFVFFSSSTLWIYLWHILYLDVYNMLLTRLPAFLDFFVFRFLFVTVASVVTTYIQKALVLRIINTHKLQEKYKRIISVLFLH